MSSREPETSPPPHACRVCGAPYPSDAPDGNCPACLWALAWAPQPAGNLEDASPRAASPRRFGSYRLIEEIARGGMGIVWKARQDGLERDVALKMILSGRLAASAQVLRFYTEARAAARLDHPGIVPIFEIGEEEGLHFYSMRLMEGPSLERALADRGAFEQAAAARIVAAVARAVHFAHVRGVLHRDVKPSNILLDADGEPRVMDFGLARIAEEESGASRTDMVLGTPSYMAPEQASGPSREVTTAADVYGLGAVLYELLTGRPPFEAETPLQTLRLVIETALRPPRSLDRRIGRSLEVICLKCLEKEPERRYASAAELAEDLERWLAGKPILARRASSFQRLASWARRRPELALSLGALSIVLALALAVSISSFLRMRSALLSEEAQRLAFQSLAVVEENPGQALALALESASSRPSLSSNNALLAALLACRERRRLLGHTRAVLSATFSPEGDRVVTSSNDGSARIWSAPGGDELRVLKGHRGQVLSASFSPDGGQVVTAGNDATARIWDAESGAELTVLSGHVHPIKKAFFSPNGERVVTVSRNTARIWSARTGEALHVLDQHSAEVNFAAMSPDGGMVVTGSADRTAIVWDMRTGVGLRQLTGHTTAILDACFSTDGSRIATASENDARIWDSTTGVQVAVLTGHSFAVYSVAFSLGGDLLATGSEDFTARIWDARTGSELHVLRHGHKVTHVEVSPDGALLLTSSYDSLARVWDLQTGALVTELRGHASPLNHAAFSPDSSQVVTACADCTARLWNIYAERPLLNPRRTAGLLAADISRDGKSFVTAHVEDQTAKVMDTETWCEKIVLEAHQGRLRALAYSPDGSLILGGSHDTTGRIWDSRTGSLLQTLRGHSDLVHQCSFSTDGTRALTVSLDGTAKVWDARTGKLEATASCKESIPSAALTEDGKHLLVAGGWDARIVDLSSGETRVLPRERIGFVACADLGPEGHTIITTSDTTRASIRSLPDCAVLATLVHPARVTYAVFSPDKRWIATGAIDSTLRIWDAVAREKWLEIRHPGYFGFHASFTAGSTSVMVTWTDMGTRAAEVFQAGIYPLDVLAAARRASFGDLTPDERDHFQMGTAEERRAYRTAWRGGEIYPAGEMDR